jgi:hypothetical protein
MKVMEDKLDILIGGLSAYIDHEDDVTVQIRGEIRSRKGPQLNKSITLTVAVYDMSGKIVGTGDSFHNEEDFFEIEIFDITCYVESTNIAKIRIVPKAI